MSRRIVKEEIDRFHDYSLYIPKRTVFVGSESYDIEHGESGTDGLMAERLIKNLTILEGQSSEPITIIMNNIGGDFYHGMALYDIIKSAKSHITVKILGQAMSMGSVILQAADSRIMSTNAKQMIHYGSVGIDDHVKNVEKWAEEDKKTGSWMEQMYLEKIKEKHPSFTLKKIQKLLSFDTILTAQESIELGLADKILGEDDE